MSSIHDGMLSAVTVSDRYSINMKEVKESMRRFLCVTCMLAMSLLIAGGCSTRPVNDADELQSLQSAFARQNNAEYDATLETVLRRMELEVANTDDPQQVTFDILVLHGGGAAGGFAAGNAAEGPVGAAPEHD